MASAASDSALNAATAEKLAAVMKAADFEGANPTSFVSGPRIVLGIDIGTAKMTVSKVDLSLESDSLNASVVTSDTGMKSIPPLVGFRGVARKIGEPAGLEERSNAKNTFADLAFYIGKTKEVLGLANDCVSLFRQFQIEEATDEIKFVVAASGNNPAMPLTGSQVAAMLLHAVSKFLSEEERKNIVGITCCHPNSYTQTQIDSLCDAIRILKIQVLPPVGSTTAIEVEFSQKHADKISLSATEQPYNVLFIDVGHTATNTLIMQYSQASDVRSPDEEAKKASDSDSAHEVSKALKGEVKHQGGDATLGARNVDFFMFEDILAVLKEKHKGMASIEPNSKYGSRVLADCKKTKEILSTISETAIILENLPGGIDARIPFSQQKLESCCISLRDRLKTLLTDALTSAGLNASDIHVVELAGGGVRIPFVRRTIEDLFGTSTLQTTLPPEVASKGAAVFGARSALVAAEDRTENVPASRLSETELQKAIDAEITMQLHDAELKALGTARDDLESYIYEMRRTLNGSSPHSKKLDVEKLSPLLTNAEDWMYEDPDGYTKEDYVAKKEALEKSFMDTSPEYFEAVEQDAKKLEAELLEGEKIGDAERAAERANGEDDHDRRKLKKEDRMRLVTRNKDEGTELFKGGVYQQAAIRYTKALQNCAKFFDLSEEDQKEVDVIKVKLLGNLAMCFLKMENYQKAINNCTEGIELDKENSKLFFRRATAYFAMKKIPEAMKDIKEAMKLTPDDKAVKKLKSKLDLIVKKQKAKEKKMAMKMFA